MAGHSKWANIKRRKASVDAKRGQIFTKISREIVVAARQGGGDPDANPRLKAAIQRAKEANIPNENIQRAIKKATGELDGGSNYEEYIYEGYGPNGVAVLVRTLSDNRNRTTPEIRHIFSKHGGNLGEAGCVAWIFEAKGLIIVDKSKTELTEDDLILMALDAGADDLTAAEDSYEIITTPDLFHQVKEKLESEGVPVAAAELTMIPKNTVEVGEEDRAKVERLVEALENHDDVQEVYTNVSLRSDIEIITSRSQIKNEV
ncbi:MAG: YebC/PmpR family DNA-binding transcriptional regulator [Peptococcaceae bacterium]|nr:YebC/PmpR family DNA-binding transcriptional regulator [Peptococcaceae bacterium]